MCPISKLNIVSLFCWYLIRNSCAFEINSLPTIFFFYPSDPKYKSI